MTLRFLSRQRAKFAALAVVGAFGFVSSHAGCLLTNVHHDDCSTNADCGGVFGLGSTCVDGFCTDPGKCTTGHDCRKAYGGGACVKGTCQSTIPTDADCTITEPVDLLARPLVGDGAPLVMGSIFSTSESNDAAIVNAIQLGVREINTAGGLNNGQQLGVVVCDNGGTGNTLTGDARDARNFHVLDYLSGTLGVPFLVGPLTSADSLKLIGRLTDKQYPTLIISPSATSPALTGAPDKLSMSDPYGLVWRTCPSDTLQGKVLGKYVLGDPAEMVNTASVLYINDAYGMGLQQVFTQYFGSNKTFLFPFDDATLMDSVKLASTVMEMAKQNADAVLIIALHGENAITLIKAMIGTPLQSKKFYFTDGSKDATHLLDKTLPPEVQAIINASKGTAPASPNSPAYKQFTASLMQAFPVDPSQFSFLAQAYDATYVGSYGVVYASNGTTNYDGRDVAAGLANLATGAPISVGAADWPNGKGIMTSMGQINITGISGNLDFDPATGEAPAPIEIWGVNGSGFYTINTVTNP